MEESLRAARRRSRRRILLLLALIVAIWGATYIYTKGEFHFFTKKIAVTDTIVIDQTAAIAQRDKFIEDQSKLISLLEDSIRHLAVQIRPSYTTSRPEAPKNDSLARLLAQIRRRDLERRVRDSIILARKQNAYEYNVPNIRQQAPIKQ